MSDSEISSSQPSLRLLLPSDGDLHQPTLDFMRDCGLSVRRPNARRYTASVPALPGVEVLFQRTADITAKVEEGSAELGITGMDRLLEYRENERRAAVLMDNLGFGRCDLVLAVPDVWLDVTSLADLADLALEFRQEGKQLRIATKYPRLLSSFLYDRGINYFTLAPASGTLEAAPVAGYADLIADLTATGATLRENRLKTLEEGTILSSQACLLDQRGASGFFAPGQGIGPRPDRDDGSSSQGRTLLQADRQRAGALRRRRKLDDPGPPSPGRSSGPDSGQSLQRAGTGLVRGEPAGQERPLAGSGGPPEKLRS